MAKDASERVSFGLGSRALGSDVMIVEAQAARVVWANVPLLNWRVGSPRVLASWKLPYSTRRRMTGPSARRASHPINAMLNAAFSVTAGRLAAQLVAQGAHPALGFLHADKPGRWSLAYDAIEPLRPTIERSVFDFVRKHQFGANDFILMKERIDPPDGQPISFRHRRDGCLQPHSRRSCQLADCPYPRYGCVPDAAQRGGGPALSE